MSLAEVMMKAMIPERSERNIAHAQALYWEGKRRRWRKCVKEYRQAQAMQDNIALHRRGLTPAVLRKCDKALETAGKSSIRNNAWVSGTVCEVCVLKPKYELAHV